MRMEAIAVAFFVFGLLLGRWWSVATPLALTLPAAVWLAVHELTDAELFGDAPITATSFWIVTALLSVGTGLLGIAVHQLGLRYMRQPRR